jgi:hypothetical protein
MSSNISNPSGDRQEKIANAAKVLGKSKDRQAIFLAIYANKKQFKAVDEIMEITRKTNVRVLQEAKKLFAEDIVTRKKLDNKTYYGKIEFYTHNRDKIIQLAKNKKQLDRFPTKSNPQIQGQTIKVVFPKQKIKIKELMIDDFDNFIKIKKIKTALTSKPFAENKIKLGFQKIVGEKGEFTDWGGETNDLFTTRISYKGKRRSVAIAFKGKGTKGTLTPKKLGKNGDQIQRLFKSVAEVFIVQYQGQIDQSVFEQMKTHATAKSFTEGTTIYYCVIDEEDTNRLIQAYPKQFK